MVPEDRETDEAQLPTRLLYPMPEAAAKLGGITERKLRMMVASKEIASVKLGRRRMIPATALEDYVEQLKAAA